MADERIDIYNENLEHQGTAMKSEAHAQGLWHCSLHCWIVRPSTRGVLFQKRGRDKELYPNTLDISAAGHYQAGESIAEGTREIVEELGLDVPFESLVPLGIKIDVGVFEAITNHEFCHVFLLSHEAAPRDYDLDVEEVEGLVEVSIEEGMALFAGDRESARATGVEYDAASKAWVPVELDVTDASFIPRVDPYYYKVFIMADLMLSGAKHLAI